MRTTTKSSQTRTFIIAATISTALALTGIQAATAGQGKGQGAGKNFQRPCQEQQLDEATIKARDTFLTESKVQRKAMAQKRAAMRALMQSESPDSAKAEKLAGELFDLREELRVKALAAGVPPQMIMNRMGGNKHHRGGGFGMGGRHHGGNMK